MSIGTEIQAGSRTGFQLFQITTESLGDQSYLLVSGDAACLVDPQRDLDRFQRAVDAIGARVVAVVETHVHNDYVSGGPALARHYRCDYVVPAGSGYEIAHRPIRDGEELDIGRVRLRALFTPGHTPHHMSYELVEEGEVRAVFSGGCVLVGACGRTDLVAPELTEELTHQQYRSAGRIGRLPDPTAIGPTHGAGSFCASTRTKGESETWTTVEKEKSRNPAFLAAGEDDFVRDQLSGLMAYPTYYLRMGALNRRGAEGWSSAPVRQLSPDELQKLQAEGAAVVDGRPRHRFAEAHVPGSVNVELDKEFATYLGWLFPAGTRFALVLDPDQDQREAARQCARIGIEAIEGVLQGGLDAWRASGRPISSYATADMEGVRHAAQAGGIRMLDVRQDAEWREGHVPGSLHVHIADLPGRVDELRGNDPVYVSCSTGHRAAMGASFLDAAGIPTVAVDGGFPDWVEHGYPSERGMAGDQADLQM